VAVSKHHRDTLIDLLPELMPAGSAWSYSTKPRPDEILLPTEVSATARMGSIRLESFRHGRYCARQALAQIGKPGQAVPMGPAREPIWPSGTTGSITHAGSCALAAAACTTSIRGIGIDMEHARQLDYGAAKLICTAGEMAWVKSQSPPLDDPTLIFCIKESIYKCIWPLVRRFVDFLEVEVSASNQSGSFLAGTALDMADLGALAAIRGRYAFREGLIVSIAWLPASESSESGRQ
jgi:4'-phosphopantetheinyl transferase EntD